MVNCMLCKFYLNKNKQIERTSRKRTEVIHLPIPYSVSTKWLEKDIFYGCKLTRTKSTEDEAMATKLLEGALQDTW